MKNFRGLIVGSESRSFIDRRTAANLIWRGEVNFNRGVDGEIVTQL